MKKYLLLLFVPLLLIGCNKNDFGLYEMRFTNISDDRYKIEVVGVETFYLDGNTYRELVKQSGTYYYEATQVNGYIFYPTKRNGKVYLSSDQEVIIP